MLVSLTTNLYSRGLFHYESCQDSWSRAWLRCSKNNRAYRGKNGLRTEYEVTEAMEHMKKSTHLWLPDTL